MSVYHVPEAEWTQFFERINGIEEGERVSVEIRNNGRRAPERVATSRRLARFAVDTDRGVALSVVDPPEVIEVPDPVGLHFEQRGEHGPARLTIDAASGDHLVVWFETPVVQGVMDGLP